MKQTKIILREEETQRALSKQRKSIDALDRKIMGLLSRRFTHVREVGKIKKVGGMAVVSKKREAEVVAKLLGYSTLSSRFVKDFYKLILREAYQLEKMHK